MPKSGTCYLAIFRNDPLRRDSHCEGDGSCGISSQPPEGSALPTEARGQRLEPAPALAQGSWGLGKVGRRCHRCKDYWPGGQGTSSGAESRAGPQEVLSPASAGHAEYGPRVADLPAARATPGKQRFCPPQGCELRQAWATSCHTSGTPPPPSQTALLSPQVEQSELHRLNSISQGAVSYICPAAVGLILGRSPHLLVSVTPTPPSPAPCTFLKLTAF